MSENGSNSMVCKVCHPPEASASENAEFVQLDGYSEAKCSKCGRVFTVQRSLDSSLEKQNEKYQPVADTSMYLNVIGRIVMKCNNTEQGSFAQLIKTIESNTRPVVQTAQETYTLPFTISFISSKNPFTPADGKTCEFCAMNFDTASLLEDHQDQLHDLVSKGAHQCHECERRYHSSINLVTHQNNGHSKTSEEGRGNKAATEASELETSPIRTNKTHKRKLDKIPNLRICYRTDDGTRVMLETNAKRNVSPIRRSRGSIPKLRPHSEPQIRRRAEGLTLGDICWAKLKREPYWPSEIYSFNPGDWACVLWLGTDKHGFVKIETLEPFRDNFARRYNPRRTAKGYQTAVASAILKLRDKRNADESYYKDRLCKHACRLLGIEVRPKRKVPKRQK